MEGSYEAASGAEMFDDEQDDTEFLGFSVEETRSITKEIPSFPTTPSKKKFDIMSDEDLDSDSDESFVTNKNQERAHDDVNSDSSDEITGSIFFSKRKRIKTPSPVPSLPSTVQSESDSEDDLFERSDSESEQSNDISVETVNQSICETEVPSKGKHRSTIVPPSELVNAKCCEGGRCLKKLSLPQLQKARDNFCKNYPTYELQRKMILTWLDDNQPEPGIFAFTISGLPVCWKAWTETLGITRSRFYDLKSNYLKGRRSEKHGSFAQVPYSNETDKVIRFLDKYFQESCDYLPNTPIWHLSSNTKSSDVYQDMSRALTAQGMSVCSNATFRSVWKTHFPHVKIPKEKRFGKCDDCANIMEAQKNELTDNEQLAERKSNHRIFVRKERSTYLDRCAAGHQRPNKFFSIAIDGMDQNKTELPYTVWRHSSLEKAWRLKIHLVGAIMHGRHPITFLDYQQHSHDSNMTANILMQALWAQQDFLPSTMYLQLDNTCKENKNQHVFGFLAYLVEIKVFDKIEACFLPVGHTHIDVDQMFSRFSTAIGRRGAKTYQDLLNLLHTSYRQSQGEANQEGARPQYARIKHMYAIREWLQPYIEELHRLRKFHHFRFTRNEAGKCILDFKPWCSDAITPWDRVKQPPIDPVLKELPEGIPDLIKPSFQMVGFGRLENMVEKCTEKGILNANEKELWDEFLEEEIRYAESYDDVEEIEYNDSAHKDELTYIECQDNRWPIDDLVIRQRPNENEEPFLDEVLKVSEAYERGEGFLPVYSGRYRPPPKEKQSAILEDQELDDLDVGMLIALDMEKYRERPLIAKIVDILPDNIIRVHWFGGSWTTKWTPARQKRGLQWVDWTEEVPKESVILFDFNLTGTGKLRTNSVKHLKTCYGME